ncbi:MAG TPA: hypothetical protein VIU82_25150 [Bosea sp. (in: a-proteobacteria)]
MSERLRIITNRSVRLEIVRRWRQTEEYVIRDRGRWGPKWLQKLVLRMATNLGMVGHMACYEDMQTIQTKTIDPQDKDFGERIFKLSQGYIERGLRPEQLMVLCGPDSYAELRGQMVRHMNFEARVRIGGVRGSEMPQFYGFDVAVVDELEGMIVIPKAVLR